MADARQIRTREAVFEALDDLLYEKPYADVNVKDLAAKAGIGRQTFYRHFNNVDAVLHELVKIDLANQMTFAVEHVREETPEEWFLQITRIGFERAAKQPRLSRIVLSGEAGPGVVKLFREQIIKLWELAQADSPVASAPPELMPFIASFNAGAISAVLLHWIEAGCSPDAETMSKLCHNLAKSGRYDGG